MARSEVCLAVGVHETLNDRNGRLALTRAPFQVRSPLTVPALLTLALGLLSIYWGTAFMWMETNLLRSFGILAVSGSAAAS